MTNTMTMRTFLTNVISANLSDEMTDFAKERIAKLDEKNSKISKKQAEKIEADTEIMELIINSIEPNKTYKASEIASSIEMTTPKTAALLIKLEKAGRITSEKGAKSKEYKLN